MGKGILLPLLFFKLFFSLVAWLFVPLYVRREVRIHTEGREGWGARVLGILADLFLLVSIGSDLLNLLDPNWRGRLPLPLLIGYLTGAELLFLSMGIWILRRGWERRKEGARSRVLRWLSESELLLGLGLILKEGTYGLLLLQVTLAGGGGAFVRHTVASGSFLVETFPKEEGRLGIGVRNLAEGAGALIHHPGLWLFLEGVSYRVEDSGPFG